MKNWITKVIFLNGHTKGKSTEEILEWLKNITINQIFLSKLIDFKNDTNNYSNAI